MFSLKNFFIFTRSFEKFKFKFLFLRKGTPMQLIYNFVYSYIMLKYERKKTHNNSTK
jgi:hypothetical protein